MVERLDCTDIFHMPHDVLDTKFVRATDYDALTEERDRLKQWQADQVEVLDEAKALITELNVDKKALEAERDRLKDQRDYYKARDEEGQRIQEEIEAERDRLALANAELLAAFDDLMSWFPDKPTEPMWQMKAGEWGADAAIDEARALLIKHKATSKELEGE